MSTSTSATGNETGRARRSLSDLSVSAKIISAIVVALLAAAAVATVAVAGLRSVGDGASTLHDTSLKQSQLVADIDGNLTRNDINILRMLAIGGDDAIAGWKAENTDRFIVVDSKLTELEAIPHSAAETDQIDALKTPTPRCATA